jgi:DNA-binding transcriptional LysR family regulator
MTLDQLRYFVAAAKYEHIHRAADSIPISASVISQAVRLIEDEIKCQLFVRNKQTIRLTPHGLKFLELSTALLGQADKIKAEMSDQVLPLSGHYRIGASHFLAAKVVTPAWTALQNRSPLLTADIFSQATWVLVDSILAGRIDFGVGFNPIPHPHLEYEEIYRGFSKVVVRKNHPIFKKDKKHPYKYLADFPATMHMATEKIFSSSYKVMKEANLEKNIVFRFDSDFAALENLKSSDNWAFMIDIIAGEFAAQLKTVPISHKGETEYTVQIIKHKTKKIDAPMQEAYHLIKEKIRSMKKIE